MNLEQIVEQLTEERDRISKAIAALNGAALQPAEARHVTRRKGRRQMSAAARARISAAMKKRWAERKRNK